MADLDHSSPVLIAGGGIGGMAPTLTLHQIGVPCQVLEAVPALKPLGVGINLQPNAVRELYDLARESRCWTPSACRRANGPWWGATAMTSTASRAV